MKLAPFNLKDLFLLFVKVERLQIRDAGIIWPGNQSSKPKGIKISTHLRVVTVEALPFIYMDPVPLGGVCDLELNKMPCPRPNTTGGKTLPEMMGTLSFNLKYELTFMGIKFKGIDSSGHHNSC